MKIQDGSLVKKCSKCKKWMRNKCDIPIERYKELKTSRLVNILETIVPGCPLQEVEVIERDNVRCGFKDELHQCTTTNGTSRSHL